MSTPTNINSGTSSTAATNGTAGTGTGATATGIPTPASGGTGEPTVLQKAVTVTKEAGAATFDKVSGAVEGIWNGLKNSNLGPWQIGGMLAGGVLAWVIGNAFGGGGLLGMVISGLLMFAMVPAGRSIFNSFDKSSSAPSQTQERERSGPHYARQREHGQPVQGAMVQNTVTEEVFFGGVAAEAREQARKAAQQIPPAPPAHGALPMRPNTPVPAQAR